MTIKAYNAGSLSLTEVRAEFGGPTSPISLFAYRSGGAYVPGGTVGYPGGSAVAIPSTGPLSLAAFYGSSAVILPTYSITPSATSVSEGTSITFTITTTNVTNGTVLAWEMTNKTGAIDAFDFLPPGTVGPYPPLYGQTGTVTINSNSASFVVTFTADQFTDGTDSFQMRIGANGGGGPWYATTSVVTINDTSQTPPSFTFTETVSSNLTGGYNLRARAMTPFVGSNGASAWNGTSALNATVTVNSGIYIVGTLFESAFTTSTTPGTGPGGIPAGSSITLINNGIIAGLGGVGGNGGSVSNSSMTNGSNGGQGGTALGVNHPISVYNNGTIGGGGGGGGGGGAKYLDMSYTDPKTFVTVVSFQTASGGGGGGGRSNGVVGANGTASATGGAAYGPDTPATSGTFTAAGAGSSSGNVGPYGPDNMQGGAGGNLGQPGFPGGAGGGEQTGNSSSGAGGAAGYAVLGGSNISWYAYGSRLGTIDNPGTNMVPSSLVSGNSYDGNSQRFGVAIVTFNFASDGTTSVTRQGTGFSTTPAWHSPAPTVIGTEYWIRVTITSNGGGTGVQGGSMVLGSWNSLAISKSVTLSSGSDADAFRVYSVEFAASNGGPVIATGTLMLDVVNTQF